MGSGEYSPSFSQRKVAGDPAWRKLSKPYLSYTGLISYWLAGFNFCMTILDILTHLDNNLDVEIERTEAAEVHIPPRDGAGILPLTGSEVCWTARGQVILAVECGQGHAEEDRSQFWYVPCRNISHFYTDYSIPARACHIINQIIITQTFKWDLKVFCL